MLRTRFLAPAPALTEGWERANGFLEGLVRAAIAGGRGTGFADGSLPREACEAAVSLLAQGEREPAKDLIRALARARESTGLPAGLVPALERLVAGFRAWTGDDAFLARYGAGLAGLDPAVPTRWPARRQPEDLAGLGVIGQVIEGLWGLWPDAPSGALHLAPLLQPGWSDTSLLGLRVGGTTMELRFQRTRPGFALRASRSVGPQLRLNVWLEELYPAEVWLDEEALGAARAVFDLAGEHEVRVVLSEG